MKYERFEDLPVWQIAVDLATKIFEWTQESLFRGKGDLANQLQRATLSISNNIAEGFERGSTRELLNFLYIARASAGEVRSMLCIVERISTTDKLQTEASDLKQCCESISRQIRGWAKSLQNSDIEGPKYLTDSTRKEYEAKKRRETFEMERQVWRTDFEAKLRADAEQRRSNVSNKELQSE